jgi:hypothetical protein
MGVGAYILVVPADALSRAFDTEGTRQYIVQSHPQSVYTYDDAFTFCLQQRRIGDAFSRSFATTIRSISYLVWPLCSTLYSI